LASTGAVLPNFELLPGASGGAERGVDGPDGGAGAGVGAPIGVEVAREDRPLLLRVVGSGCCVKGDDTAVGAFNDRGLRAMPR
jgi:hypothetical protein